MKQDLNEEIVSSIFNLSRALRKFTDYQGGDYNLSAPQLHSLMFIKEHNNPTMSEISSYFGIALPTATSMIDRLVKADFLKRVADENDRRIIRIEMTGKGEEVFLKCINKKKEHVKKLLLLLPEEDRKVFNRIINDLLAKVQEAQQ